MGRWLRISACLFAGLIMAVAAPGHAAQIDWQACPDQAMEVSGAAMDCGWLVTGARLADEPVRIRVVVLRAHPDKKDDQPVIYVPGGPGESAGLNTAGLRAWRAWQQRAGWSHDVVLFDPRATGESRPRLGCDRLRGHREAAAATALGSAREFRDEAEATRRCYQRLGADQAASLGPRSQLSDLNDLVDALGVSRINLWGLSYGTRIARLYAKRHPDRVRTMVLDSMFPFERDDLLAMPAQVGGAVAQLDRYCTRHGDCLTQGQPPSAVVHDLLDRYARQPPTVNTERPGGGMDAFVVTPYRLLLTILLASYDARNAADTVARLVRAHRGADAALKPMVARLWRQVRDDRRNEAVFWSTRCAFGDGVPDAAAWRQALSAYPEIADYLAPARKASVCAFWEVPHTAVPAPGSPLKATTLIISGDADVVTPAAWTRRFIESHPQVRLLSVPGAGHAASLTEACAARAMARFWDAPRASLVSGCGRSQSGR